MTPLGKKKTHGPVLYAKFGFARPSGDFNNCTLIIAPQYLLHLITWLYTSPLASSELVTENIDQLRSNTTY